MSKVVELTAAKLPYEGTVGRPRLATCPYAIGLDSLIASRFPQRFRFCEYVRITSLPYHTSPAPLVIKTLSILGCFLDNVGYRDVPLLDRYFSLLLGGMDVSFAEVPSYKPARSSPH